MCIREKERARESAQARRRHISIVSSSPYKNAQHTHSEGDGGLIVCMFVFKLLTGARVGSGEDNFARMNAWQESEPTPEDQFLAKFGFPVNSSATRVGQAVDIHRATSPFLSNSSRLDNNTYTGEQQQVKLVSSLPAI